MPNQPPLPEDEIRLPAFRNIIKEFFQFIFWVVGYLTLVFVRNLVLIAVGFVIGGVLGYLYFRSGPTHYKGTMIVRNNELTKRTYGEMMTQLNNVAASKAKLATELNTSEQIAREIVFFDSKNMDDDPLIADTSTKLQQSFKIIVGLTNLGSADTAQKLLVSYINNRPYLKNLREEQTRLYQDRLKFVENELQKLDSLQREYNRFLGTSRISATFYNNAFNPAELYGQSVFLFNQREQTLKWLNLDKDAVQVVDGLKVRSSPSSMGPVKAILVFGLIGMFIAFCIGFYRETRKRLGTSN